MKQEFRKLIDKKVFILISLILINIMRMFSEDFYWEKPMTIAKSDSSFPITISNDNDSYVFWEEVDVKNNLIYLSGRRYDSLTNYTDMNRFAGPFSYSGKDVPDIYTAAILSDGTVAVAVLSELSQISVYTTKDKGVSFSEVKLKTTAMMVAPRIYKTHDDKFKLFTSLGESDSFSIYYSDSADGMEWTEFSRFEPTENYRNPFIPVLEPFDNGDIVVFQSQYMIPESNRTSYQIFMTYFKNEIWSEPVLVTDEKSLGNRDVNPFYKYQNQRPYLYNLDGTIYMSWERTKTVNSNIWVAEIDESGIISDTAEQISSQGNASRGILFSYDGNLFCTWFDTRSGKESVYMAEKIGFYWDEFALTDNNCSNLFSYPLILDHMGKNMLAFVWQKSSGNSSSISMLSPDIYVAPPDFYPITFMKGKQSNKEDVKIQIIFPEDSSNIAGYSYTWEKDTGAIPEKRIQKFPKNSKISAKAEEEGEYVLSVRVTDYAGNWSEPASIVYSRDITPPDPPVINIDNVDKYGFLASNDYSLKWNNSLADDTVNYLYEIDYLGGIPKKLAVSSRHPLSISEDTAIDMKNNLLDKYQNEVNKHGKIQKGIKTSEPVTSRYYKKSNGVYILRVSAVDEVGNISDYSSELFILNKFEPSTRITGINQLRTEFGDTILTIYGYGFTYDGTISEVYIDRDGKAPYDFILKKENKDFKVVSDEKLSNVNIGPDIDEGKYKIGLNHTDRGIYFSEKNILDVPQNGTVKIEPDYIMSSGVSSNFEHIKYVITQNLIVFVLFVVFVLLIILFILIIIRTAIHERKINNLEIIALMRGGVMPLSDKNKIKSRHLTSLKTKLISFTFVIIILVAIFVTVLNGMKSIQLQSKMMAAGLKDRTEVLLDSLCSSVKTLFPTRGDDVFELISLPDQKNAMQEIKYITIIGQKVAEEDDTYETLKNLNYVWATNDPNPELNIGSDYGKIEIQNEEIRDITKNLEELDKNIGENKDISDLSGKIAEAFKKGDSKGDAELRKEINKKLANLPDNVMKSKPYFDIDKLDNENTDYIFYRPVIYREGTSGNYVHAVVYLELSTKTLIDSILLEIKRILVMGLVIACIAVVLGILGSYLFASLIVRPVKKLEAHVTMIGQTKNKINLKGKDVKIKSRDEVGRLGDAINLMTRELVQNAEEEELAMDGKAVQKAFLPLADTAINVKNTIAEYEDDNLKIYGYYEGESGVSGDYFDYKKLDKEWFCVIKCDASGHGIPAAIIMTVVATIFRRYFENWSFKKNGTKLNVLVEQINDFIEGLGLKGKFATLIICLLNMNTGELYMCNAGDNLVHIFDGTKRKMKVITLKSVPTAGVFTSDLVSLKGGFVVEKTILNKGDTLFLYTDGIEESNRRIRNFDFSVRQNEVEVKKFNPKTRQEETFTKLEDAKEEFGPERVSEIIESVYNKKKYILTKEDNPKSSEVLEFNFEKCEGSVKDTILALASIEKVYRLYKPDSVQSTDYIKIDKKIDDFLSKYFNMYEYYASNKTEATEISNYIDYDFMLEDEQSDDLTMLAIKRI